MPLRFVRRRLQRGHWWTCGMSAPGRLALAYTLPVTGGTLREIAFQPSLTGPVAVSGGWVYWTSQIEIERAHVNGTGTQMLVNFPTYGGPNSLFATPVKRKLNRSGIKRTSGSLWKEKQMAS